MSLGSPRRRQRNPAAARACPPGGGPASFLPGAELLLNLRISLAGGCGHLCRGGELRSIPTAA